MTLVLYFLLSQNRGNLLYVNTDDFDDDQDNNDEKKTEESYMDVCV